MLGANILLLITDTLLSVYTLMVLLRCVFMLSHVDFYHPIVQAVVRMTERPLMLLRPIAPAVGRVDFAAWLLALAVKALHIVLIVLIQGGAPPAGLSLLAMALIQVATIVIYIYIFAIIILAVSSWFISGVQALSHPFISLINAVSAPLLINIRRFLPSAGVIDFSPLIALLLLYIALNILKSLGWA